MSWSTLAVIALGACATAIWSTASRYRGGNPSWRAAAAAALAAFAAGATGLQPRMLAIIVSTAAMGAGLYLILTFRSIVELERRAHLGEGTDA